VSLGYQEFVSELQSRNVTLVFVHNMLVCTKCISSNFLLSDLDLAVCEPIFFALRLVLTCAPQPPVVSEDDDTDAEPLARRSRPQRRAQPPAGKEESPSDTAYVAASPADADFVPPSPLVRRQ